MAEPERFVLDTRTGPCTLADIRAILKQVWAVHPEVPEDIRLEVSIATGEIGANIVEHAGGGQPIRMRMQIHPMPTEVHITFTDDGAAATQVDLTTPREVDLSSPGEVEELAERGRGLAVARKVLSQLSYHHDDIGNHWTLISKHFHLGA